MTAPEPTGCHAPCCLRPAALPALLCGTHHRILESNLTDLRADLNATVAPSLTGWRAGEGSGGALASERDPINFRIIDAQRTAPAVLAEWAAWIAPRRDRTHRAGHSENDRQLIVRNLKWLITQPEVTDLLCQIRALWGSLRGHLPVRRCTCGGPVWSDRGGGWCSWCATAWAGRELLELPRAVEAA